MTDRPTPDFGLKGTNSISINQSTMQAAMQLWLTTYMVGKFTVTNVRGSSESSGGFVLTVTAEEPKP